MAFHPGAALRRLREALRPDQLARERDDEMAFHLDMEVAHNLRRGMTPDEARRAAVIAFGGRERFREEVRDARGVVVFEDVIRDGRLALRRMRRAPAFAAGVIATIGIGVGAAIGVGGIVHRVLLSKLPYAESERLVRVSLTTPGNTTAGDLHSNATYVHLATARSFDGFAAFYTNDGITITDADSPERVTAAMVTPGLFSLLGVKPVIGSLFAPTDTAWAEAVPILISEGLWERRYNRDPKIIGKRIAINRGARDVIGVIPRSFDFPTPDISIWYALSLDLATVSLNERFYQVIGRVRPGVSIAAAESELNAMIPALATRFPKIPATEVAASGARVSLQKLADWTIAGVRGQLMLLGAIVLVVLLIATTNLINLFLLRTDRAQHETAIALSLGATSSRLLRRFVAEGLVLGAFAAVPAVLIAGAILGTRLGFTAKDIPRLHEVEFGVPAVLAAALTALVLGSLAGSVAFARATADRTGIADRLRGSGRATAAGWRRAQRLLVTSQVAFALVLLVSAALLARSFDNLRRAPLGFRPENVLTFEVSLPYNPYASTVAASAFHARVMQELRAMPGTTGPGGAGITSRLPLAYTGFPFLPLRVERADGGPVESVSVGANLASPEYFEIMGIPRYEGRTFRAGDLRRAAPAVQLSAVVAKRLFGDANPVGRRIRRTAGAGVRAAEYEVVGVVGDVPGARIEDGPSPILYFPVLPDGDGVPRDSFPLPIVPRGAQYVVRGAPLPSAAAIREVLQRIDRRVPAMQVQPMTAYVEGATARVRLTMLLLSIASVGALLLGVIGVYSVVAYAAAGRRREFGVRLALGATPARLAGVVWRDGALLTAIGATAGLLLAAVGTRVLQSLLFEVSATSVKEFVVAVLVVSMATLAAALVPARRAARTDPAIVLRGD